jgi:hypothetical protein
LVTLACLVAAFAWAGWSGLLVTAILGVMEVSLSFDNAVVNATVLRNWNHVWRMLFLTVGILVAVFGMRLLFPLAIVSFATGLGLFEVGQMALDHPDEYSEHLMAHHAEVAAFGGVFLLLVFLNFLFDEDKKLHWLGWIEEKLGLFGRVDAVAVLLGLATLLVTVALIPDGKKLSVLMSGVWGVVVYVAVDVISSFLEKEEESPGVGKVVKAGGIGGFLYLEVLDASFSFDGVIGAFAITKNVVIIMLGLAIGAMFVRSLTVYLVEKGALEQYVYLEHGAHYAIGILALIMLASMKYHVPEVVTGLIGVGFILLSLYSSILYRRRQMPAEA